MASHSCLAAAVLALSAAVASAATPMAAVTTPGTGELTICRDWLVTDTCDTYHHIALSKRIAVGDVLTVMFGSNPKQYDFHVVGIRRHRRSCTLLSPHTGAHESGEKIVVMQCRRAPDQGSER